MWGKFDRHRCRDQWFDETVGHFKASRAYDGNFQIDRTCLEAGKNSIANNRSYLHGTRILREVGQIERPFPISCRFNQNGIYRKIVLFFATRRPHWTHQSVSHRFWWNFAKWYTPLNSSLKGSNFINLYKSCTFNHFRDIRQNILPTLRLVFTHLQHFPTEHFGKIYSSIKQLLVDKNFSYEHFFFLFVYVYLNIH